MERTYASKHAYLFKLNHAMGLIDAVLLSHDVCTAMIHTHKCGLDRTNEQSLRPYFHFLNADCLPLLNLSIKLVCAALFIQIFTGIQTAQTNMSLLAAHICSGAIDSKRSASHRTFTCLSADSAEG